MSISRDPCAPVKFGARDLEEHLDYPTRSALLLGKDKVDQSRQSLPT